MYRFNEEKTFADCVDGQMVVLMTETGKYFTFSETASALINDLVSGYEPAEIEAVLKEKKGEAFDPDALKGFINEVIREGVLDHEENSGTDETRQERPPMECGRLNDPEDCFEPLMEGYDDIAEYFMIDPIHEVDPELGWPNPRQE